MTLEDILFFSTGVTVIPPVGFTTCPSLEFLHDDDETKCKFPKAKKCSCTLQIPLKHENYTAFVHSMNFGIKNALGFGYA